MSSNSKLASSLFRRAAQAPPSVPAIIAATTNATLGFEKLLVVSPGPSWRTRGLEAAGKLTGLEFTIPSLPAISDQQVQEFQQIGNGNLQVPGLGSAKAWVAHLHMLEYFIASGLETALIVEDDFDFDTRLRTEQIPLLTDNLRAYAGLEPDDLTAISPYGDAWDILWLGHCGAEVRKGMAFFDPLRVDRSRWYFLKWIEATFGQHDKLWVPDGLRIVQPGGAVCTWAYAVTRRSAQKVLSVMARGDSQAYDIGMLDMCNARVEGLRCLTINPTVVSTYIPPKEAGKLSLVNVANENGQVVGEAQFDGIKGSAPWVSKSARCNALFGEDCRPQKG
ncbi:hypothetical protein PG999_009163 [Apiospora kogelbergensis]|uniref:Glycosyltransferase family 25 protein n=1 Tax=Apiospora kogelbergensis TaxID=1337665 RepID=A0AAW0QJZ1_9PEZI